MKSSETQSDLKGLLICPLHSGYIEFEYQKGTKVIELKEKIVELWGEPKPVYRIFPFVDIGMWHILCKDKSGAYVPLDDTDEIPIVPPPKSKKILNPITKRVWKDEKYPDGIIHERDFENAKNEKGSISLQSERLSKLYKKYTHKVILLALVAIHGG